jgi:hypothetical protein
MSERMTAEELLKRCDDAERYAKYNDGEAFNCALDLARALRPLITEKPAPTVTPLTLTEEERALAKEAATITDDDAGLTARALRLLGAHNTADEIKKLVTAHGRLGRALERLSASPTAPKGA